MKLCEKCRTRRGAAGQMFSSYTCSECNKQDSHANTAVPKICKDCADKFNMCRKCKTYIVDAVPCSFYIHKHGVKIISQLAPYEFEDRKNTQTWLNNEWNDKLRTELDVNWKELQWMLNELQAIPEFKQWQKDTFMEEL